MFRLVLITALINVPSGLQWLDTVPGDGVMETCVGSDIELPWNFTLSDGETVEDIRWLYQQNGRADELIAMYSRGFFNPMPAFSGRVQQRGAAGIVVRQAAPLESGNYSVEVNTGDAANPVVRFQRTVVVHVVEPPTTKDGSLHVQQEADAVYDNTIGQYRVQLTCGDFSDLGHPSAQVVWTTPEGQHLQSSSADNGTFYLLLPNPPSGGNYTCTLPPLSPASRCLPPLSPLLGGATVAVDQVKASFSLLGAQQREMQREWKAENQQLRADFGLEIQKQNDTLKALKNETERLRHEFETNDATQHVIGFHGTLTNNTIGPGRIQPFAVITNEGNAFNGATGEFTAPRNGTYFFVASADTFGEDHWVHMQMKNEGTAVSSAYSHAYDGYTTMATCHAALHLTEGERVWLEATDSHAYLCRGTTAFTGFLIRADN